MTSPFMRAYALAPGEDLHRRNAPAMGGWPRRSPSRTTGANEAAMEKVRADKLAR